VTESPCDWPLISVCATDGCSHLAQLPPATRTAVETYAATWLWQSTGRRYGLCGQTIRPCRRPCGSGSWYVYYPVRIDGSWYNCPACGDRCSCSVVQQVEIPGPVHDISEVKVDGVALDPSAYRVDNYRWLVRIDGGSWPICQDIDLADTEAGTWAVTYTVGKAVPEGGQLAAGALACQISRLVSTGKCDLPQNWSQINRQGVSITRIPEAATPTGLWIIDSWVQLENRPRPGLRSPDLVKPRTVTWQAPAVP
jgi:hypothetical protein